MNADEVRAYVAAKWPNAMKSPFALAVQSIAAADEADRAIDFARLQSVAADTQMRDDAMRHALQCIDVCEAQGIEYDEETLAFNIQSNFPDLDLDACDEIARKAQGEAS